jgi:ABC-type multidrug transport system permease subunit
VLTAASALAFQIEWGNLLALGLVLAGLVAAATGFGILIIAFLKSTRQAGAVIGGVLAITGMLSGLYSTGFQGASIFDKIGLILPQGWALRGLKLVISGAAPQDVLVPLAALLAFGIIFFTAGTRVIAKRFA